MYYEPYKKRRGAQERERRGGCLPRALWFLVKFLFKLAVLLLVLAVVAYALPPGLFNVRRRIWALPRGCRILTSTYWFWAWTPTAARGNARTR